MRHLSAMRTAVVLFNLGGPDSLGAVRPFLFNLFRDPAIIGAPTPVRQMIAALISWRRAPVAREIYQHMGGRSPILPQTEAQADALAEALNGAAGEGENAVFIAMRYWHPFVEETIAEVEAYDPERIVLLPLYPQYSTTTTGSSLASWQRAAAGSKLATVPTTRLCCYPAQAELVAAQAGLIETALATAGDEPSPRLLLSAHGLPKKIVEKGDPYQWQVEENARAIVERLDRPELDWRVCYQSRVGPLEWIGPSTDSEIERAGKEGKAVVVAPVAFVSEHSETLVELDIEYRALAKKAGVPAYHRVPAVGTDERFINGLVALVRDATASVGAGLVGGGAGGARLCPGRHSACALQNGGNGAA